MRKTLIIALIVLTVFLIYYFAFYVEDKKSAEKTNVEEGKIGVNDIAIPPPPNGSNTIKAPEMSPSLVAAVNKKVAEYNANPEAKKKFLDLYTISMQRANNTVNPITFDGYLKTQAINELQSDPQYGQAATSYKQSLNIYVMQMAKTHSTPVE